MNSHKPWYRDPVNLRALGLKIRCVHRYGESANWLRCRSCGNDVFALNCTDCGWTIEHLVLITNHIQALRDVRIGLALFRCANECNASLIERPPAAVLLAQAEDASREHVEPRGVRSRKPRKVSS